MKYFKIFASLLICLLIAAGCGSAGKEAALPSEDVSSHDDTPSSEEALSSETVPSYDTAPSSEEALSLAELARAAYSSFLTGDTSLFDSGQLRIWGLEGWSDFLQTDLTYEYTYMDLDGDGIEELLIQMEKAPLIFNAVFHYADGKLFCWNLDMVEMTSGAYPLEDGAMVSQYDYNDTHLYTIFRYLSDGEHEILCELYARESLIDENSEEPCPYYTIDGTEVEQSVFEDRLEEMIQKRLLPRSAWTTL